MADVHRHRPRPLFGTGGAFQALAPKDLEYAHNRYQYEAHRHYKILDDHLAKSRYMVGDTYTIVDMAFWGWARMAPFVLGDDVFTKYPNVKRLVDEISARPAAARAIALKDKFTFKAEMDDEARTSCSAISRPRWPDPTLSGIAGPDARPGNFDSSMGGV